MKTFLIMCQILGMKPTKELREFWQLQGYMESNIKERLK